MDSTNQLPWLDYSTLTAINTCPRWGVIHALNGKRFTSSARSMPLEAGRAMHDMFAAVRMFELIEYATEMHSKIPDFIYDHGQKLFNNEQFPTRWEEAVMIADQADDYRTRLVRFALHILETAGFYDDPNDRRRTQSNLEAAALHYIDRYPIKRFIPYTNADGFVGVENGFDIVLNTTPNIRFVGKIDGICMDMQSPHRTIAVHENKTGSRIDTVWSDSFAVGHQVTGYCVAASKILNRPINDAVIWGTQIPVPKAFVSSDGTMRVNVSRSEFQYREWREWVQHTLDIAAPYMEGGMHPVDAPMYTHSCNRYFRSCSLIPLCAGDPEERRITYDNEMTTDRWNPLESEE